MADLVQRLQTVIETQNAINGASLDPTGVMQLVTERAARLTGAQAAVVELAEGDEMVYRAATGTAESHVGLRLRIDGSLSGLCVRTGEVLQCDDTGSDPRVDADACRRIGAGSMVVAPLICESDAVGVLKVVATQPHGFDDEDVEILRMLAGVIASSIRRAQTYARNEHDATHDRLTGLINRWLLEDHIRRSLARGDRHGTSVDVLFIDLDGFKEVNDTLGHEAGDAVLRAVARRLTDNVRATDSVARLGGDEFVVLCEDLDDEGFASLEPRLRATIAEPIATPAGDAVVRASIGRATAAPDDAPATLLARADSEMYRQKRGQLSGGQARR